MNKKFAEWYRTAKIEPTNEQLKNRWDGIVNYITDELEVEDITHLIKLFYGRAIQEDFRERYIQSFINIDSAFDYNNELELSVLAGGTLIEIIENNKYSMLAMLATLSFSFLNVVPVVPNILVEIWRNFNVKTSSIREQMPNGDHVSYKNQKSKEFHKLLKESTLQWTQSMQSLLIDFVDETNVNFNSLLKQDKKNKEIINIYSEDSQILWWLTGEWSNDLDKPFHEIKHTDASIYIGKELADKITNLPGPFSVKAIIHKMLECCNKKNRASTITLKNAVDNLDVKWKEELGKKYDIDGLEDITPIMFAISKSLTVEKGVEWNPQFEKIAMCNAEQIVKPIHEMAFQTYLECLTIKCYANIEE